MSPEAPTRIPTRQEVPAEHTWNLETIYASPAEWDADLKRLQPLLEKITGFQGKLTGPAAVREVFEADDELSRLLEKLYTYAHLRFDEDTANAENQARNQRIQATYARLAGETAWVTPEILQQSVETLKAWQASAELKGHEYSMELLIRRKPHTLSRQEETLLSKASEIFGTPSSVFGYLTNADMKFPDVADEKGNPQPLSNGRFIVFLENRNREVRRRAFETLYDTYIGFENTLAATLSSSVKLHNYHANVRNFESALQASLSSDNVPVALYDTLVASTHNALPEYHKYIELRKKVLGLDDLNMYDLYVPIVPEYEVKVEWEEAVRWVKESLAPMGEEYLEGVEQCFNDRWVDVYENKGKRSGAYSGGCYDTNPYILMNYQGTLDWVFTLAHELGHSMHSWLARRAQPYRYSSYTIFVAEIASMTNEMLLHHYLLQKADDPRFRAYLLNHLCDQFKGTMYRQTMFAEFERKIHEMDAEGEPLTAKALSDAYEELNRRYQGPSINPDPRISHEWSRIPHFYYNFYVYKYATGFCASQVFFRRILGGAGGRDQYLKFLSAGGSGDPLDLVKRGGVDLTDEKVLTSAFATFGESVQELSALLK